MRPLVRPAALLLVALSAIGLDGCGGGAHHRRTTRRHTPRPVAQVVDVYSSLPLHGPAAPEGRSIARGIRLALRQAGSRDGMYVVHYRSLTDAIPGRGAWDAQQTAANARKVLTDPAAVGYIGEFDSAATQISLPILNQAGIPQLSPWSPYVGLTQSVPGITDPGELLRYYPTRVRTFLRIAPDDAVQAGAMLQDLHDQECSRLAILHSAAGAPGFAQELSGLLNIERLHYGIRIVSVAAVPAPGAPLRRYLLALHNQLTGCLAYVGALSAPAEVVLADVHLSLPHAELIASDRACAALSSQPVVRLRLATLSGVLRCTFPAVASSSSDYAGWLSAWQRAYGGAARPDVWAAYGYAAMRLILQELGALGPSAENRAHLLKGLFSARVDSPALGGFGFDTNGNATLRSYGLYELRTTGAPVLLRVLQPAQPGPNLG